MEIITYILQGALEHRDSMGNGSIIRRGDDGSMQVRLDPLPEMPDYLKQVIEEMK